MTSDAKKIYKKSLQARPHRLIANAKKRSRVAGIPFTIKASDIYIPEVCPILGVPIVITDGYHKYAPSLDRVIPALGYVPGNVRVVSILGNAMKSSATRDECVAFADNILDYLST